MWTASSVTKVCFSSQVWKLSLTFCPSPPPLFTLLLNQLYLSVQTAYLPQAGVNSSLREGKEDTLVRGRKEWDRKRDREREEEEGRVFHQRSLFLTLTLLEHQQLMTYSKKNWNKKKIRTTKRTKDFLNNFKDRTEGICLPRGGLKPTTWENIEQILWRIQRPRVL